jgi:hypothetical protein
MGGEERRRKEKGGEGRRRREIRRGEAGIGIWIGIDEPASTNEI